MAEERGGSRVGEGVYLSLGALSVPTSNYRNPAVGDPRGLWAVLLPRTQVLKAGDTFLKCPLPTFLSFPSSRHCGFSSETEQVSPAAKHMPRQNSLPSLSTSSTSHLYYHQLATAPLSPWIPLQANPPTSGGTDD